MLRRLLGKVDDGRFGRALAGMQAGWQWQCDTRQDGLVEGYVKHGSKQYLVAIRRQGRRYFARCSCDDAIRRGVLCKHIAFVAMSELGLAAAARSAHKHCRGWGAKAPFFWSSRPRCPVPPGAGRSCGQGQLQQRTGSCRKQ